MLDRRCPPDSTQKVVVLDLIRRDAGMLAPPKLHWQLGLDCQPDQGYPLGLHYPLGPRFQADPHYHLQAVSEDRQPRHALPGLHHHSDCSSS